LESEAISTAPATTTTITQPTSEAVAPPMVDSVEYLRAAPPVYPKESQRRREYGTVILRVLVDALGRPAQILVERSSGYSRLDAAGREAVEKFLFRPYEVNGIAQPAQVLIPIEFARRST
jgi:protein TonB